MSSDADTSSSNNTSGPVKITVNCAADVKVVKTTTTPIVTAGAQASYGITVTANGPASSTNVVLTDLVARRAHLDGRRDGQCQLLASFARGGWDHADL